MKVLLATVVVIGGCWPGMVVAGEEIKPVAGLIERILPGHGADFILETIAAPSGENIFEVEGREGKIVLRGDGPLSQAVALNWYLKHDARVAVSWYAEAPVKAPAKLPVPTEKVRKTTRLQNRFFLNYCTFGYSFPWWKWRQWERFIDWMALNGINLPLVQGATEAIWQKVWTEYGLTDKEIRGFFSGPAHLPWHRMGNLDSWDGPLPQSYIDGQLALTKQIVARERALGMKPILPAFAGHVPPALKRVRPATQLTNLHWCGVSTYFISPGDPLFREIQVKFLREQEKQIGTDHYYGTDPFNEMKPPSMEPSYLASVSRAIYGSMGEADPQAVWVQMAWTFMGGDWSNRRLQAMIDAVPKGRMVLLDYFCEEKEIWRRHKFFGAPFIWNYLGNFGGNTPVIGPIQKVNKRITAVMNDASVKNFAGIGSTLEGLNNQSMYEFIFDRAWAGGQCDTTAWLREQARCRAGASDQAIESAFASYWLNVIGDYPSSSLGDVFMITPSLVGPGQSYLKILHTHPQAAANMAWKQMLDADPAVRKQEGYLLDLADITRTALTGQARLIRGQMYEAWKRKDAVAYRKLASRFLEIGNDLDSFLATRPEYLFGAWVRQARAWGKDAAEADYYERNARTIVTTWFGRTNGLNDYAGRNWNGLLKDYYLVRWKMYLDAMGDALEKAVKSGKPVVDAGSSSTAKRMDFEWAFARSVGSKYPEKPVGDCYEMSRGLYKRYVH